MLSLAFCVAFLSSCAHVYTARGVYYRVQEGETLESIANKYALDPQNLAELNHVESSAKLKVGRTIYIPGVTPSNIKGIIETERSYAVHSRDRKRERNRGRKTGPTEIESPVEEKEGRFSWPVEGELSSQFGMRRGRRHDGIDIRAKTGTPVMASADGEVAFSKRMRGYGNLVILKHNGDFFTVYAHNSINLVKKGDQIKKGEVISKVGRTGRATGPHLHFEIREGTDPKNPLLFLPQNQYASVAQKDGNDYGRVEEKNP